MLGKDASIYVLFRLNGDVGSFDDFPMNAVRWITPPREIAALVTDAGPERFAAKLFHFGDAPRDMGAELYRLAPGTYAFRLAVDGGDTQAEENVEVSEGGATVSFTVPPKQLCAFEVSRRNQPPAVTRTGRRR